MAFDNTQIIIAPLGHVYVAPLTTTLPTDVVSAWPSGWTELGYTDEKGVTLTPTVNVTQLMAWQTGAPVKTVVTGAALEIAFGLQQFNIDTTSLFFFGATWTLSSGSSYKLTIPSSPTLDERMLGIEWGDGTHTNRLVVGRGSVTKHENITIDRKAQTILGITFTAEDNNGSLATLFSNASTL